MRTVPSLAAFAVIAVAAGSVTWLGWRAFQPPPQAGPPSLDCPAEVDLGPQEHGTTVVGRFRVENRGGSDLLLSHFGTSCSCAGVEIEQDGLAKSVEELRVPPGGGVDLSVRVSIGVRPGMPQTVLVRFTTTDPNRPDAAIKVVIPRVTGGLSAEPAAVVFGNIPQGQPATKTIRLYSNGNANRQVHFVRSLQPDRFEARLVPFEATCVSAEEDWLVAVVEVTARTNLPQKLDGSIEVVLCGEARASDMIAILGEVVPPIIARPSALVLPRYVSGKLIHSGRVTLTSRDGIELAIALESIPDGLTAVLQKDPDTPRQWLLEVSCKAEGSMPKKVVVRLRATGSSGAPSTLNIPITIIPANP